MLTKKEFMNLKIISKKVNSYVFPLIATNVAQLIINQLSLHFAVNDSSIALSGISIIQNLLFAVGGILGAFSLSFNIKGARAFADNNMQRFRNLLKSSLLIDLIIGIIFFVLCLIFGQAFLKYFYGFDGELLLKSTIYLRIMSPYILLTLLTFLLSNLLKVEKKTKPIFAIGLFSSIIDVLLNYYLVPILGISGAAISAIFSLTIIVLGYFYFVYPLLLTSLKTKSTTKKELISFGFPLAIQEILESVIFIMIFDALMGRQGLKILSIYAVISQLFSIVRMPAFIYSGAISIFIPEAQKDGQSKNLMLLIYRNAYLMCIIFAIILTLCSNIFAHFFSSQITTNIIPLTMYTMIVMGITPLYESSKMLLQSVGDERWVVKITSIINIASISILLLIQILNWQSYQSMYMVYGLSLVLLSIKFIRRASVKQYLS